MNAPYLYIFANRTLHLTPPGGRLLHAGGLQYCIETVEELAVLEHSAMVRVDLDGVFMRTPTGEERVADPVIHLSDRLTQGGITDNWFTEGWAFGNGVTNSKTEAQCETKLVEHKTGRTIKELIAAQGYLDLSKLTLYEVHDRTEGWQVYAKRWRGGACPQFNHQIHLTWMAVKHELGGYGYKRIQALVEEGAEPKYPEAYSQEPGKHFSTVRAWKNEKAELNIGKLLGVGR